jgi:ParB family chromosome partitioning protein
VVFAPLVINLHSCNIAFRYFEKPTQPTKKEYMNMAMNREEVRMIPIKQIRRYTNQPRKYISPESLIGLVDSIKDKKIRQIEPIIVRPLEPPVKGISFELINGERRWRACELAGVTEISAIVRKVKDESEQYLISVISNLQQSTLTPMELAYAIERLQSMEISQREIGKLLGKSGAWVQMHYCLSKLTPKVLALTGSETPEGKRLSHVQAYLLVGLPEKTQIKLAHTISDEQLSVADARRLIAKTVRDEKIEPAHAPRLCMIETFKIFQDFSTRTDYYLEIFLSMDNKKFHRMFEGKDTGKITRLKTMAHQISDKFRDLGEALQKIEGSMISNSLDVESVKDSGDNAPQSSKDGHHVNKIESLNTTTLLKMMGISRRILYAPYRKHRQTKNVSFWHRQIDHLEILETAKKTFKAKIQVVHPDKVGGNGAEAAILNQVWEIVEKRFSLHGFNLGK